MTNRKSHTRFRLVPKSATLDDLEGSLHTLFQSTCSFWAHHDNFNEHSPILYQRRRCSPMALYRFWQYKFYADTRRDSLERGRQTTVVRVTENIDFQGFRTLRLQLLRKWGQHYYIVLFSPLSPFHWPQSPKYMTLNQGHVSWMILNCLNGHLTLNFPLWLWEYYWLTSRILFTYLL